MKISEQWLREWVNPAISRDELVKQLTMAGLEVDGVECVAGDFTGVIVALVESVETHPDADKLHVCKVNTGKEILQIVCGAKNVRAGLKVALAQVGAQLPNDLHIKQANVRGVESSGMLCSVQELGMAESADGLLELPADAPLGEDIRQYFSLNDAMVEINLTPNRGDCLSVSGLARDVSVLTRAPLIAQTYSMVPATIADTFPIEITAQKECPRYVGRVIRHIKKNAVTPIWMQERLRRSGIRSIHPVVDVTNYVMIELGQPMHAFDLDKLDSGINVRLAKQDESIELLDGQTIKLRADTLVISDKKQALAIAGVMGGQTSSVTDQTQHLFLESAFFNPITVAGKARSYGLHTDSSHRFERGVDFQLQQRAIERATELLLSIVGGQAGPLSEVANQYVPELTHIELRSERIERVLGMTFAPQQVTDILERIGCVILENSNGRWEVTAPSHRFDVSIEVDLIEELARVHGYNHLPISSSKIDLTLQPQTESTLPVSIIRRYFIDRGYQEAITYSFVDPALQQLIEPDQQGIELANPISSDMSVMRVSLWAGLLKALQYNQHRQQLRVRFFETGLRFIKTPDGIVQDRRLAGLIAGSREPEGWSSTQTSVDFFDMKGDIEALLGQLGRKQVISFLPCQHKALHPGQAANILLDGKIMGVLGALHPSLLKELDLIGPVYLFDMDLSMVEEGYLPKFNELSRFPEVRRDLALVVGQEVPAQEVLNIVRKGAGEYLTNLTLFDVYQGKGIDPQRKSLAIGLTWQHTSRTLNDDEVNALVGSILAELKTLFNAILRE